MLDQFISNIIFYGFRPRGTPWNPANNAEKPRISWVSINTVISVCLHVFHLYCLKEADNAKTLCLINWDVTKTQLHNCYISHWFYLDSPWHNHVYTFAFIGTYLQSITIIWTIPELIVDQCTRAISLGLTCIALLLSGPHMNTL